jgi:hypothetical protein
MIQSRKFNCKFVNNENTNRPSLKINVGCIPLHSNALSHIIPCQIVVLIHFHLSFFSFKVFSKDVVKKRRKENGNLLKKRRKTG